MRADRLLSLIMLLQARGRTTAETLAAELEVSVRTIYRDLTALSISGVPIYTGRGPGGGVGLVEEYRTSLTGLTPAEVSALFMVDIPAPLRQLGVGDEFKQALLKLSAALPDSRRHDEARARQRIHLDSSWWFQPGDDLPCLAIVQQALWQDRRLRLKVRQDFFDTEFEQEAEPYGLVAKANVWHLVYRRAGSVHVLRIADIICADMLEDTFVRPADFDLAGFWEKWCAEYESQPAYMVKVRVSAAALPFLPYYLEVRARSSLAKASSLDKDGWVTVDLPFDSFVTARTRLLGLGRAVEVLDPLPLRKSLLDFAQQIVDFYNDEETVEEN